MTSIAFAAIVAALSGGSGGSAPAPPPSKPAIAVVFHISPPGSNDADLAAADVALRAPEELGEPLRAMRGHAGARLAFAVDSQYLAALDRAGAGNTALSALASGSASAFGPQSAPLLKILARHRPLDSGLSRSPAGSRYLTLATAAANELNGDRSVPFTSRDLADFAGVDAQVALDESGIGPMPSDEQPSAAAVAALARADKSIEDELKADVRSGAVELIATPQDGPVLPLLVDAGGKSTADPQIVAVGAKSDAQWLSNDAVRGISAFAQRRSGIGFYSPYGAYDDATGVVVQNSGAAYALFSDRVVRGMGGEGTEAGLDAASAASLHPYALTVAKGITLPVLFWREAESDDLQSISGSDSAMSQRLQTLANEMTLRGSASPQRVFVLRVETQGPWSQRPDARTVVARFVATIASGRAGSPTTPGTFLHAHPPKATAYGYPPAAESGSFALWMGSADQTSLWNALVAARKAAGGDAAFDRPQVRPLLIEAEAGQWYSSVTTPLPNGALADRLDAFRALIANIYRAAGAVPPAVIAPLKLPPPAPLASPAVPHPPSL